MFFSDFLYIFANMEEIKSYFSVDSRFKDSCWFLIDTDMTLSLKVYHMACVSCHNSLISSYYSKGFDTSNVSYIKGNDDNLSKPTIQQYIKASETLKKKGVIYNKKKGTLTKENP